jgi:hypothetical protein
VIHICPNLDLDVRVSNHTSRPRTSVKMAHTTVMYPCAFNQPLLIGMTIAGIARTNVKKTTAAFAITTKNSVNNATYNIIQDINGNLRVPGISLNTRSRAIVLNLGFALMFP